MSILFIASLSIAADGLPKPSGYVNDFAEVLSPEARQILNARVAGLERESGIELAVVTVPSLGGESIEAYAVQLFEAWGIGKKGKDNGVLILVAPNDRSMRIEVGYGLEGVMPDGLAGEIIRTVFTPAFRQGDYSGGITNGVDRVIHVLHEGEILPKDWQPDPEAGDSDVPLFFVLPFFGLFIGLGFFALGHGVRGGDSFFRIWGAGFGGIPLLMSVLFVRFAAPTLPFQEWILPAFAVVAFVAGMLAHRTRLYAWLGSLPKGGGGISSSTSTGWSTDDSSSSGGSSGSSSSSSSFGGGSSGGGGASGNW